MTMTVKELASKINYDQYKIGSIRTYKELAPSGRVLWAVDVDEDGFCVDVTERERAIQELQQAKKELEMARLTAQQAATLHVTSASPATASTVPCEDHDDHDKNI